MKFRKATVNDAEQIQYIYNQAILDVIISAGNQEPVTVKSREEWIRNKNENYPIFVLENSYKIVGFGFFDEFVFRPKITTIAQIAVFIDREHRNRLSGAKILMEMIKISPELGFKKIITLIFSENIPSIKANAHIMEQFMVIKKGANLRNKDLDIVWFNLDLGFLNNQNDFRTKLVDKFTNE